MPATHTLYVAPMTCAIAVQAHLLRHAVAFELEWLERGPSRRIQTAGYALQNRKAKVPALRLPDGELLTEVVAILAHLDETHGPDRSSRERRRLLEWLSFVATELHQAVLGPTFDPESPADAKLDAEKRLLGPVLDQLQAQLGEHPTLLGGNDPSVADLYLMWAGLLLRYRWPERVDGTALERFNRRMWDLDWVREPVLVHRARVQAPPARE